MQAMLGDDSAEANATPESSTALTKTDETNSEVRIPVQKQFNEQFYCYITRCNSCWMWLQKQTSVFQISIYIYR